MSGLVMGLVWEQSLDRPEKYVLLAYADHADQNGGNVYPSVDLIVRKTGYSERAVQHITHNLEMAGYLVADGVGPNGTNRWKIPVVQAADGGAKIAPRAVSKTAPEGIAPEGIAPEPSVTVIKPPEEEEGQPGAKIRLPAGLQKELTRLGIYAPVQLEVQARLEQGWSEADVVALIDWMKADSRGAGQAAGRFVARLREGTRAPAEFYRFESRRRSGDWVPGREEEEPEDEQEPVEPQEPAPARPVSRTEAAWAGVVEALRGEMPSASWVRYVRPTRLAAESAAELVVAAPDGAAADWLESRLASTVERMLVGRLNRQVRVSFQVGPGA